MTTLQQLAEKSDASELTETDVEAYAAAQGLTTGQAYDALALHLATGYAENTSCAEATYFLQHCPNTQMDGNNDGEPCEQQWCK